MVARVIIHLQNWLLLDGAGAHHDTAKKEFLQRHQLGLRKTLDELPLKPSRTDGIKETQEAISNSLVNILYASTPCGLVANRCVNSK